MATASKPSIMVFTTDEGHASIAQAITEQLEDTYQVVTFHRPLVFHRGYRTIYRNFPGLFNLAYKLGSFSKAQPWQEIAAVQRYYREIKKEYLKHRPVAIICTYWAFLPALAKLEREYKVPVLNVVANPVSLHPLEISNDISLNVVFDQDALTTAKELNPEANIESWGWFVRKKFQSSDKKVIRHQLGLNPDLPLILISGGSEGTQKTYDVVEAIQKEALRCQCVVVCGSNAGLLHRLTKLADSQTAQTEIIPLGFTHDMHLYLAAADLFVTKAGPNSIFEAAICRVPQIIFCHIAGQETGNLGLVATYQLGVVAEELDMTTAVIRNFLRHPQQMPAINKSLLKLLQTSPDKLLTWIANVTVHAKK